MATYLIFFGSSDGFTYVPFDESGIVVNFERLFPDLDVLDTSTFIIDNINNSPVLAKYFFKIKGKQFSILKLYGYGQSSISSRVEGSNIGVALFSDQDIEIDQNNINFLQAFYENFTSLCLVNKKFKNKTFESEAILIYNAFIKKYGFDSIVKKNFNKQITYKNSTEGYHLKSFNQEYFNTLKIIVEQTYFTTDLSHLERFYKRWNGSYKAFVFKNNKYISLKELEEIERQKQELHNTQLNDHDRIRKGSPDTIIQQLNSKNAVINARLNNATIAYQILEKKVRKIFIFGLIGILILLTFNLIQFFNKSEDTKDNTNYEYKFNSLNELENVYLNIILKDTIKMKILNPLIKNYYHFLTNKNDTIIPNELIEMLKKYNQEYKIKIDTNIIKLK